MLDWDSQGVTYAFYKLKSFLELHSAAQTNGGGLDGGDDLGEVLNGLDALSGRSWTFPTKERRSWAVQGAREVLNGPDALTGGLEWSRLLKGGPKG